jgi:hypothetical protein
MSDLGGFEGSRQERTAEEAWKYWNGFVTVAAAEMSRPPVVRLARGNGLDPINRVSVLPADDVFRNAVSVLRRSLAG